jgi:hypothetical protein
MRYILLILSTVILVGCGQKISEKPTDKFISYTEIQHKVALKLLKEENLRAIGSGVQGMDQIKMLALSFCYYEPVEEEKARELLLIAINELISAVNEDERIRPYLHNYPFDARNVEIAIFLHNPDGSKTSEGKFRVISATDGILEYQIDDPRSVLFTTLFEETYEEAIEKQALALASKAEKAQEK